MRADEDRRWPVLLGFLALCFAAAAIGAAVTFPNLDTWYIGLAKPSFQPPNAVFGPVWTALYAMMATAAWMAWRAAGTGRRDLAAQSLKTPSGAPRLPEKERENGGDHNDPKRVGVHHSPG